MNNSTAELPLVGIRVLDLGRVIAAPYCAQILGDLGAEVVKIERAGVGDEVRDYGPPFLKTAEGGNSRESGYFLAVNRNKKSITADFSDEADRAMVRGLAATSHVVLENFKTGDLARYGLDYASIKALNPDVIYCSVTGFGQTGPYARRPSLDAIAQGMSGLMSVTGEPEGPPVKVGVVIVDLITGLYAAIGVLAGLRRCEVQGRSGQHIDLALLDTAIAMTSHRAMEYLLDGNLPQRVGNNSVGTAPAQLFQCSDGLLSVQAGSETSYLKVCAVLHRMDLAEDPRFCSRSDRVRNIAELAPLLENEFLKMPMLHWYELLTAAGVVAGPIYTFDRTFSDPHVKDRGVVVSSVHPLNPALPLLANPIRFSDTPLNRYEAPPMLGEHNGEATALRDRWRKSFAMEDQSSNTQ